MSSLFTQEEIDDIRNEVIGAYPDSGELPDTCTIYRPPNPATATRKPSGAIADTYPTDWQTVEAGVKCRVEESRLSGTERAGAGTVQATGFYLVVFDADTVIDATCQIKVTASLYSPLLVGMDLDVKDAPVTSYAVQRVIQATKSL